MQLVLTEDQELLAKTAADFVGERSPVSRVRELRDSGDPDAFSRKLWKEMAELGWVGIPFPEAYGGAEMGLAELAVVLEALGRTLAPEPFLSTVLLGGQTLALGASPAQQEAWIPKIVEGEAIVALACDEARSRWDLAHVKTRAEASGDGFRLTGEKTQVLDGHVADLLLVSARTAGEAGDAAGVTIFAVRPDAAGVTVTRQSRIDSRNVALVRLDGVEVGPGDVVGAVDGGAPVLEAAAARATVGLCAEMVGAMQEAFDRTLGYMKQREQFGVPIGSFQALKHRAAREFISIELSRTAVMAAARAVDAGDDEAAALVSLAKAQCSEAAVLVANESVQMHGGIGVTDEHDIGFYLKRARVAELSLGDAAFHRRRWAELAGY
ncbi:MAG TPA: acyl-CoA dehydrogenase family protein [Myxococcota bacterium]|nr:acyl-CoA dehydrogenase family protein [Myxococcota bacterium]